MKFPDAKPKNWWKFYLGAVLINTMLLTLFLVLRHRFTFSDLPTLCLISLIFAVPLGIGILGKRKVFAKISSVGNAMALVTILSSMLSYERDCAGMIALGMFILSAFIWFVCLLIGIVAQIIYSLSKRNKAEAS